MKMVFALLLLVSTVTSSGSAQEHSKPAGEVSSSPGEVSAKLIDYAVEAALEFRSNVFNKTDFKVLKVIAVTQQKKNGKVSYNGCIHFIGNNIYESGIDRWVNYSLYKGKISFSAVVTESSNCHMFSGVKNDVTAYVQNALSR